MRSYYLNPIRGLNRILIFRAIMILFWILLPLSAIASSHLVLFLTSGGRVTIPIDEQPKISFEGSIIIVGGTSYQMDNVQKWMVGDPETVGIEDVITVTPKVKGARAKVFNAAGVEVPAKAMTDANGRVQFDLRSLPTGVYVIQIGTETLKVTKR